MNMQELYNPATFLDSTCFSELYPSHNSHDSFTTFSSHYCYSSRMPNPQRRVPTFRGKKQPDGPPILPSMGLPLLRLSGLTAQQDFISEARALAPSEPPSTPLLFQAGQVPGSRAHSTALASVHMIELKDDTIIASDSFIDRLFPKEHMPFPIDPRIFKALAKKGLWSHGKSLFAGV